MRLRMDGGPSLSPRNSARLNCARSVTPSDAASISRHVPRQTLQVQQITMCTQVHKLTLGINSIPSLELNGQLQHSHSPSNTSKAATVRGLIFAGVR
jgi:hypothetical protein